MIDLYMYWYYNTQIQYIKMPIMSAHITLRECQNSGFRKFAEHLAKVIRSGQDAILTPYGADVLAELIEPNSVVFRTGENAFLEYLDDFLKHMHSNCYAYYLVTYAGINKLRFKEFARFLETELNWRYQQNALPKQLLSKMNLLLKPYELLNAKAAINPDVAEHYELLSKIITRLLMDEWMGVVKNPFLPKDKWMNRGSYSTIEKANWIIKQPHEGKMLYTNLLTDQQVLTSVDQAFTPYLYAYLQGYSENQLELYRDEVTQFEIVDELIFIDSDLD